MDKTDIYQVYIKVDEKGRLVGINSSAFLDDTTGWLKIDEGTGDRYHHAQGNYLPRPIMTGDGVWRYKSYGNGIGERTAEEIAADVVEDDPSPDLENRVGELEEALDMILTGVTE